MLKLRHSDDFASPAGSAWRIIVVQALMPWLRRFRIDEITYDDEGRVVGDVNDEEDIQETSAGKLKWNTLQAELSTMRRKMEVLERQSSLHVANREQVRDIK